MRLFVLVLLAVGLSACQLVYKLPTRQGNVLDPDDLDKLELGMTRDQVRFVLGTPMAASLFNEDRWEYLGYYRSPRGQEMSHHVTLYFQDDQLVRMVGVEPLGDHSALVNPDVETVLKQERKDRNDDERAAENTESGVVIQRD